MSSSFHPDCLPDLLPIYYKNLFPYGPFCKWLAYGNVDKTYFCNREFSFTLEDDVYLRYQSFSSQQELEKEIQKKCPHKIDIGAVFSAKPKDHKTLMNLQALQKELVFDIDMTDYDDVRSCCSEADICLKCWPLMTMAVKIIDRALEEDFGLEHRLWVYSGRRGVHCWVCDERARKMSPTVRTAVAEYLTVVKGGENQIKKVHLGERSLHPSLKAALKVIAKEFPLYVNKQNMFGTPERIEKVISLVPDDLAQKQLREDFEEVGPETSEKVWKILKKRIPEIGQKIATKSSLINTVEEIMFQFTYPRLDVNVSTGVNHLLKSPFCVHPKTGRVCVPMDVDTIDSFNPFEVPTISQICEELNDIGSENLNSKTKAYRLTSLKKNMETFDKFLDKLKTTWAGELIKQSDEKMDF